MLSKNQQKNKTKLTYQTEYINHSIAYTVELPDGNKKIQINKLFKTYPKIHNHILEHEIGHIYRNGLIKNLLWDFKPSFNPRLIYIVLLNPSTWISFLPIHREKNVTVYNISAIFSLLIFIFLFLFLIFNI